MTEEESISRNPVEDASKTTDDQEADSNATQDNATQDTEAEQNIANDDK